MKFWKSRNFWEGFRSAFSLFPSLEFPARRFDPNGRSVAEGFEVDLENARKDWGKAVQAQATMYDQITDLRDELNAMTADFDRIKDELYECKAELARVRRNHLRRMQSEIHDKADRMLWASRLSESAENKAWCKRHLPRIQRFDQAIRAALAQLQDKEANQ